MPVNSYTVRVFFWTRDGWDSADVSTSAGSPRVALASGMNQARYIKRVKADSIVGAVIVSGPPGTILLPIGTMRMIDHRPQETA